MHPRVHGNMERGRGSVLSTLPHMWSDVRQIKASMGIRGHPSTSGFSIDFRWVFAEFLHGFQLGGPAPLGAGKADLYSFAVCIPPGQAEAYKYLIWTLLCGRLGYSSYVIPHRTGLVET